jgi:hypothetical protein
MNQMVMRMHAARAGMGEFADDATRPRTVSNLPTAPVGHSTRDTIFAAIGLGLQTVNNIFAPRPVVNPYAVNPYAAGQYGVTPYAVNPNALPPGQAIGQGIGTGFSNFAGQFGVSPTTIIILAVVGVYLFTRK